MTEPPPPRGRAPEPTGAPLRVALRVSRARRAARAGDVDGALRVLDEPEDPACAEHPDVLDLRARLHAQRGALDEAAACWRRVLARRPDDPAARAGLARVARLTGRGPRAVLGRHRARTAAVLALSTVAAALAVGGTLLTGSDPGRETPVAAPTEPDRDDGRGDGAPGPTAESDASDAASEAAAEQAALARELARELAGQGLRVTAEGGAVEVAFTEVVFAEADRLTPGGAERLAALGAALAAHTGPDARVEILGHAAAVPGAPDSGGSVLALWRALVAARELSAAADRPLTDFTTGSADQRDAPFDDAALNRTVTVEITPSAA
ncbi:Tetratricopeptide repeat-containing protein [Streptomyces zhaozhouensis]|uniref:Tetratricopeptide repeat-containing protein n=1 Tax=Streptomyces zhaozhouensis TaxID=1300267 RepID=A0A286E038_9ACTN|nr:tetratricopeptide repeat protein [Streptomyces zhaozhouensis]SOD64265.1 Tetratricopeptide repeat-containing protein [Streptomyces zhaozhouensis]